MKCPVSSRTWLKNLMLLLSLSSTQVLAHYPTLDCAKQAQLVHCKAGYSDGTAAQGAIIRLYSYDEELLFSAKADQHSEVSFVIPKTEYFISFNPGHDRPAEVDYIELD